MKVPIDDIKFIKELYPRFELDNYTINQYRQSIDQLPPILISRNKILIDGYHRIQAYKLEERIEIEAEVLDIEDEKGILLEAIRRNSTHGKQLAIEEKRKLTPQLWKMGVQDTGELAGIFSVSPRTIRNWTQKLREEADKERDTEILELYLQYYERDEIGEIVGLTGRQVWNILGKNGKFSEISKPDNLELYNVWSVGRLDPDQLKYPGQTPLSIIENIIYYYTDPPQTNPLKLATVLDPMAGSGVVRDACRNLIRRYLLFDIKPLREDIPIQQNDVLKGLPENIRGVNLVYFDPPYFNLMSEYPDNEFTRDYESFLGAIEKSLKNFLSVLSSNGKVALILKPMNEEMMSGEWFDMTVDSIEIARKLGYKLIKRICAPLGTNQFKNYDVTRVKDLRVMLNTLRDIVILEKI